MLRQGQSFFLRTKWLRQILTKGSTKQETFRRNGATRIIEPVEYNNVEYYNNETECVFAATGVEYADTVNVIRPISYNQLREIATRALPILYLGGRQRNRFAIRCVEKMMPSNSLISKPYKQSSILSGSTFARRSAASARRRASLPESLRASERAHGWATGVRCPLNFRYKSN